MHVVCTLPNAANVIGGKLFVPVKLNEKTHFTSEELTDAEGERLLSIPGFQKFRGDAKLVADAVTKFRQQQVAAVREDDRTKDRTIHELQQALALTSDNLAKANMRCRELEEENAELRKEVGEPSGQWPRARLAKYAEGIGLIVNEGNDKDEILEMIEARISQRG